jgi:pimeloyl-ACP methyl ester carboxylesterase
VDESLIDQFFSILKRVRPEVLAHRLKEVLNVDVQEELRRCNVPVLYLYGKKDKLVGERCLKKILKVNPKVEIANIDAPHLLLQRKPEAAMKIIGRFRSSLI